MPRNVTPPPTRPCKQVRVTFMLSAQQKKRSPQHKQLQRQQKQSTGEKQAKAKTTSATDQQQKPSKPNNHAPDSQRVQSQEYIKTSRARMILLAPHQSQFPTNEVPPPRIPPRNRPGYTALSDSTAIHPSRYSTTQPASGLPFQWLPKQYSRNFHLSASGADLVNRVTAEKQCIPPERQRKGTDLRARRYSATI